MHNTQSADNAALVALDKFVTYRDRISHSPLWAKMLPLLGMAAGVVYTVNVKSKKVNSGTGLEFVALGLVVGLLPLGYNVLYPSNDTLIAAAVTKTKKLVMKSLDFEAKPDSDRDLAALRKERGLES